MSLAEPNAAAMVPLPLVLDVGAAEDLLARGEYDAGQYDAGQYDAGQHKRIAKGGREVWPQANDDPILDQNGRAFKVVKYCTDNTARIRDADALARAVRQVQDAVRAAESNDLTRRVPMDGKSGDIGALCAGLNGLRDTMVSVVAAAAAKSMEEQTIDLTRIVSVFQIGGPAREPARHGRPSAPPAAKAAAPRSRRGRAGRRRAGRLEGILAARVARHATGGNRAWHLIEPRRRQGFLGFPPRGTTRRGLIFRERRNPGALVRRDIPRGAADRV